MFSLPETARTDPVVTGIVSHQQRKAGGGQAVRETSRVLVDITESLTIQVAEGSSSRDPTLRVVFQLEFFRFVLSSCWSGGRLSLIVEIVNHESSADHSSGDGEGVGQYSGDRPGYDEI